MKCKNYWNLMVVTTVISVVLLSVLPAFAATSTERITSSVTVVREMSSQDDAGRMADLVKSAKGVVIIPSYVKAAIGIGGSHGEGLILRRDASTNTWYGPVLSASPVLQ